MIAAVLAMLLAQVTGPATPSALPSAATAVPSAAPSGVATADAGGVASPLPLDAGDGGGLRRMPMPLVVPKDAAEIVNGGSTNTAGFQIVVEPNGRLTSMVGGVRQSVTIAKPLVAKLFRDLAATTPLGSLGARGCMKSASFGSVTRVFWRGAQSGDLSCGGDARSATLEADTNAIETAAKIDTRRLPTRLRPL